MIYFFAKGFFYPGGRFFILLFPAFQHPIGWVDKIEW